MFVIDHIFLSCHSTKRQRLEWSQQVSLGGLQQISPYLSNGQSLAIMTKVRAYASKKYDDGTFEEKL